MDYVSLEKKIIINLETEGERANKHKKGPKE